MAEDAIGCGKWRKNKLVKTLLIVLTFVFVMLAWVMFRVNDIKDAFYAYSHMLIGITAPLSYIRNGFVSIGLEKGRLLVELVFYFVPLFIYGFLLDKGKKRLLMRSDETDGQVLSNKYYFSIYLVIGLLLLVFSNKGLAAEFVYFQF